MDEGVISDDRREVVNICEENDDCIGGKVLPEDVGGVWGGVDISVVVYLKELLLSNSEVPTRVELRIGVDILGNSVDGRRLLLLKSEEV